MALFIAAALLLAQVDATRAGATSGWTTALRLLVSIRVPEQGHRQ